MGTKFLLDLADVIRTTGVTVIEEGDWEFRSRSTGGYDPGLPSHIMWHHTASGVNSDGQRDVDYICYNSSAKPIANLYLDRKGQVWICAGGATNTNGRGVDTWGGGVPLNSMNKYAIGIEIANNGAGEFYTYKQHVAIRKIGPALCLAYNIPVHNNRAHFEWAPSRKVDPAGPPTPWADPDNRNMWDMDLFRSDIEKALAESIKPPTDTEEEEIMIAYIAKPPSNLAGNPPWLLCINGAVRYATNVDAQHAVDEGWRFMELNKEQYNLLLKGANLA